MRCEHVWGAHGVQTCEWAGGAPHMCGASMCGAHGVHMRVSVSERHICSCADTRTMLILPARAPTEVSVE